VLTDEPRERHPMALRHHQHGEHVTLTRTLNVGALLFATLGGNVIAQGSAF
jgi:hypothetical protein